MLVLALVSLAAVPSSAQDDGAFIETVLSARVIELNFVWDNQAPLLSFNPPFAMSLQASHRDTKGMIPGGIAFAAEMMFFSGQHGAPTIDAIGHMSANGKLFGGLDAEANESAGGLKALGIETYPKGKFVNRGILLDVARYKGVDVLEPGYEITVADLEATAKAQGVAVEQGDSVLIRTGFGNFFNGDREKYPRPAARPWRGRCELAGEQRNLSDRYRPVELRGRSRGGIHFSGAPHLARGAWHLSRRELEPRSARERSRGKERERFRARRQSVADTRRDRDGVERLCRPALAANDPR